MKTKPVAVLYARYSPRPEPKDSDKPLSKQDEWKKTRAAEDRDKNSCDKQIEYGREYCARMGYDLREESIFRDDALSGGSMRKRPGLKAALAACRRGMIFVARDTKRVARSMLDTFTVVTDLTRRGVIFETLVDGRYDATDVNKIMVFGIKAVVAECERLAIKKDTKAKMLRHQANGRRMSKIAPFGFAVDPEDATQLLPLDVEQPTIHRIKNLYAEGIALRAIGRQLESEGMLCRGGKWQHRTLKKVLLRAGVIQR